MNECGKTDQTGSRKVPGWEHNIYEHIEVMRLRLQMYIYDRSIISLETYLHGYEAALSVHRIAEQGRPPFHYFREWLMLTREGSLVCGWARHFLEAANGDNELALETFFKFVAKFGKFRVVEGEFVELPPGHGRSKEFMKGLGETTAELLGYNRPGPTRVQLVYLRPGEYGFLRYWHGDKVTDQPTLYADAATARKGVEWQFGVSSDEWVLRPSR